MKSKTIRWFYKYILKPIFFTQDAERIHNCVSFSAELLGKYKFTKEITSSLLKYGHPSLKQKISGINFANPIGLSAGFDYNGHMAEITPNVGFGFSTVGTVTAKFYEGNKPPRLKRLSKSESLLVNKGFKSDGVDKVLERLRHKNLSEGVLGVSVGSSNLPEINTIEKAISDYTESFTKLKDETYIKYFELNISCPNTALTEGFGKKENFDALLHEIKNIHLSKPIFIKMANELDFETTNKLIKTAIEYKGIKGFIFSNLVKNRLNPVFNKDEIKSVEQLKGNFSGKPTLKNSNQLIHQTYKAYGKNTIIIGSGGISTAWDAYEKIKHGASLVQLITGMIYEGPQLIGEINKGLVDMLKEDGYENISEAVGAYHRP